MRPPSGFPSTPSGATSMDAASPLCTVGPLHGGVACCGAAPGASNAMMPEMGGKITEAEGPDAAIELRHETLKRVAAGALEGDEGREA